MLKFQKQAKSREINVIFKEQTRLPNSAFLQALAIALLLHLVGLAIFQVSPFKLGHVTTIFPPVQVKIEYILENDRGVLAELESDLNVMPLIPEPAVSRPKIYANLKNRFTRDINYYKEDKISTRPFENLTRTYTPETFITLKTKTLSVPGTLHIHLFGELANRPYALYKPLVEIAYLDSVKAPAVERSKKGIVLANTTPFSIDSTAGLSRTLNRQFQLEAGIQNLNNETYEGKAALFFVKVEDRTGKIFWYEPLHPLENKKQNKKTKKILEGLRFQKKPEGFISNGWIEIGVDS